MSKPEYNLRHDAIEAFKHALDDKNNYPDERIGDFIDKICEIMCTNCNNCKEGQK